MTLARTRTLATPLRSPDHARSQPFSPGGPSLAATPSARANTAPPVEVKPDFSDLAIVGAGDELLSNPALGPAALLKAWRFVGDSRDEAAAERLDVVNGSNGVWRCHTIFNCMEACPKEIDIPAALSKLKRAVVHGGTR